MKLGWINGLVPLAYGAVDVATEYIDEKQGFTEPLKNVTDIQRLLVFGGSAVLNLFDVETKYSEILYVASAPLAIKTIKKAVETFTAGYRRFKRPPVRRTASSAGFKPVVSKPLGARTSTISLTTY